VSIEQRLQTLRLQLEKVEDHIAMFPNKHTNLLEWANLYVTLLETEDVCLQAINTLEIMRGNGYA
jgi:hypothetical protein